MQPDDRLPETFLQELTHLEHVYLQSSDPIEQSGFHGGPVRWRAEREPILDAIDADGDLLDVGCANGYLLECLVQWGRERGLTLTPYGLDHGRQLVELARHRQPQIADHFFVGNAWYWVPPKRFHYVYTLLDQVPPDYFKPYLHRLLTQIVAPGGRLIAGGYGSRSREVHPRDVAKIIEASGLRVTGETQGGNDGITRFAWIDHGD